MMVSDFWLKVNHFFPVGTKFWIPSILLIPALTLNGKFILKKYLFNCDYLQRNGSILKLSFVKLYSHFHEFVKIAWLGERARLTLAYKYSSLANYVNDIGEKNVLGKVQSCNCTDTEFTRSENWKLMNTFSLQKGAEEL